MWIANGLARHGPTLGGVLSPIANVGDTGTDPENQKLPIP